MQPIPALSTFIAAFSAKNGVGFPPDLLVAPEHRRAYDGVMKETIATNAAEDVIAKQLALVAGALEDCFAKAQTITGKDEYGYKRAAEFQSAVTLLEASAKLGLALARIKGEFNQNIRVHRGESRSGQGEGDTRKRGSIGQRAEDGDG